MACNKLLKFIAAFVLGVTILASSSTVSVADTIDDCSYLIDMGSKAYNDTTFYEFSSSFLDESEFIETPAPGRIAPPI